MRENLKEAQVTQQTPGLVHQRQRGMLAPNHERHSVDQATVWSNRPYVDHQVACAPACAARGPKSGAGVHLVYDGPEPLWEHQRGKIGIDGTLRNASQQFVIFVDDEQHARALVPRKSVDNGRERVVGMRDGRREMNKARKVADRSMPRIDSVGTARRGLLCGVWVHAFWRRRSCASTRAMSSSGTNGFATKSSAPA